jgi:hypothetical protein
MLKKSVLWPVFWLFWWSSRRPGQAPGWTINLSGVWQPR